MKCFPSGRWKIKHDTFKAEPYTCPLSLFITSSPFYNPPLSPFSPMSQTYSTLTISHVKTIPRYQNMGKLWTLISQLHSIAGPVVTLLYPLYASVVAIESQSKLDDEQWLAYWIIYSFLSLAEMVFQPVLEWIPIWYDVKLLTAAWLVLPQFEGASYLYERFVREHIRKYVTEREHLQYHPQQSKRSANNDKTKKKFVEFVTPKKQGDQEAY